MEYNPTYFDGKSLYDTRKKLRSFRHFKMKDGFIVGMFQGSRGDNPKIDFIIKFLEPGKKKRLRTPEHMHWVVDLLLKREKHERDVGEFVKYFLKFYYKAPVFKSVAARRRYKLKSPSYVRKNFKTLIHNGTYSVEYLSHIIELFTLCEKVSPRENKMFEKALKFLNEYCEGKRDFYSVMNATKPGYGRR